MALGAWPASWCSQTAEWILVLQTCLQWSEATLVGVGANGGLGVYNDWHVRERQHWSANQTLAANSQLRCLSLKRRIVRRQGT
jgi:hypothetical protein